MNVEYFVELNSNLLFAEENALPKPKPHPPKKRRGSCKEDKVSRRKSGSPHTPEKKTRWSNSRRSESTNRRSARTTRQNNNSSQVNLLLVIPSQPM